MLRTLCPILMTIKSSPCSQKFETAKHQRSVRSINSHISILTLRLPFIRRNGSKRLFLLVHHLKPLSSHWIKGRPPEISIFPCPWPFFPVGSNTSQSVLLQPQLIFSMLFSPVLGSFYPEVSIEGLSQCMA